MTKYKKTEKELSTELREQIAALRSAAKAYDEGVEWQAKHLASTIYILCHDGTGRTKSLLGLLRIKGRLRFLSSLVIPPSISGGPIIAASAAPLLMMRVTSQGARYVAPLGDHPLADQHQWHQFGKWYEEKIFHPLSRIGLSRKNMVFTMRTQDGGGHVDDHLSDKDYHAFKTRGSPTERSFPGGVHVSTSATAAEASSYSPILNGDRATIRQIAWELDQSLQKAGF